MRWIAIIAVVLFGIWYTAPTQPEPAPPGALDLRGTFQGATAAEDAATLAAMADEIANVIEYDGEQEEPLLGTGLALDALRTRTREFVLQGQSLGQRHPAMRNIVAGYLESELGTSGGAITNEQRAKWVSAYREIARSARHAISQ